MRGNSGLGGSLRLPGGPATAQWVGASFSAQSEENWGLRSLLPPFHCFLRSAVARVSLSTALPVLYLRHQVLF